MTVAKKIFAECGQDMKRLAELHAKARPREGVVVAIVLAGPPAAKRIRAACESALDAFSITLDVFGIARDRLGLVGPRTAVVIRSDGTMTSFGPPGDRSLEAAYSSFLEELGDERM